MIRELRAYEVAEEQRQLDVAALSRIDVDQFYGIELSEFPARIAETALWMMDHIMNNRLSLEFGESYARIPLQASPHILQGDALETDWAKHLPPEQCSYLLGNPPFGGFVYRAEGSQQPTGQLMKDLGAGGKRLDYVAAWFLKAGAYFQGRPARVGFVATNSITQGEQVEQLWPAIFERYGLEIAFAHRTFAWGSDARGKANVHVIIIGLTDRASSPKDRRLFTYDAPGGDAHELLVDSISPYLVDASALADPHMVVRRRRKPVEGMPTIQVGTKPVDGGLYLLGTADRAAFLEREPGAIDLLRPFLGSSEFIRGKQRWILHVADVSPARLRQLPAVMERIHAVRTHRSTGGGALSRKLADKPTEYHVTVVPTREFLAIPETSSARREYVPIGWLEPPAIPSNALLVTEDAHLWQFGLLTSAMHMAWLSDIGGRLKSDYRYSSGLVYNTFPLPAGDEKDLQKIEALAQAILDARSAHPDSTLADLYDPDVMPTDLRRAHQALDRVVDRLYRRGGFASERERVEHLLGLYEKLVAPLTTEAKPKRRRRR